MTLKHLRIFRQVWKEGSVTKAASALGMTQPAVSVAIGELEDFYQTKLFDRISRKMYLTPSGEKLLEYADSILSQYDESVKLLRGGDLRRELKVGISSNFAAIYAPSAMEEFKRGFPDINLVTYAYASSTIISMLTDREIDIGIIDCDAPENFNATELSRDDYVLLCTGELAKTLPPMVSPEDLKGVNLIFPSTPGSTNRPMSSWLKRKKVEPNIVLYASGSHAMTTTVMHGLAALPILRMLALNRIKYYTELTMIELCDEPPELTYSICTLKGKTIDAAMRGYIEIMQELCSEKK